INLDAAGAAADLTLTQVVAGSGGNVTLQATGAINGTPGGATDVTTTGGLAVTNATGLAAAGTPLETALGTFAANVGTGGVFVTNQGTLTIGTVGSVNGIAAIGGDVTIS